jgi:hypothetical protein
MSDNDIRDIALAHMTIEQLGHKIVELERQLADIRFLIQDPRGWVIRTKKENQSLKQQLSNLTAKLSASKVELESVVELILSAHNKVFPNYAYIDSQTTCDLLVADLLATRAEFAKYKLEQTTSKRDNRLYYDKETKTVKSRDGRIEFRPDADDGHFDDTAIQPPEEKV